MEEQSIIFVILSNKEIPGKVIDKKEGGGLTIEPLIKGLQLEDGKSAGNFFTPSRYVGNINNVNKGDLIAFIWDNPGKITRNSNTGAIVNPIAKNPRLIQEEDVQILLDNILLLFSQKEKENLRNQSQSQLIELENKKTELEQEYKLREDDLNQQIKELDLERQRFDKEYNRLAQSQLDLVQRKDELENERESIQVEKNKSIELKQEINRYTALLPLIQDSNLDSIISVIPASIPITTDLEPENLGDNWHKILTSRNLLLPESIAISYLVSMISALCSGNIVLLNGTVGVGKSSMIEKSAEALGGKAKIIPVRPSWLDPSDLLGFFDPLAETFRPSSFTSAIKEANSIKDRPFIICLDELNLARIENYGADLLSTLEYAKNRTNEENSNRKLSLYSQDLETDLWQKLELLSKIENPNIEEQLSIVKLQRVLVNMKSECEIPQNLVLIGTLNSDETTYELSPKVIDRSYAITYPPTDFNLQKVFSSDDEIHGEQLSVTLLHNKIDSCIKKIEELMSSEKTNMWEKEWKQIVQWNEKYISQLGIPIGYRVRRDYITFFAVSHCLGIRKKEYNHCLSYFLFTKLLPRITFFKDGTRETLCQEWIAEIRRDYSIGGESHILEQIESQILDGRRRNVRYWG